MSQSTRGAESHPLSFHLIDTPHDRRFSDLVAIYTAAHPASELKPVSALAAMVRRPEYLFLAVALEEATVGFAITICFPHLDACLLEYMAVSADWRGQGIGRSLFRHLVAQPRISGRYLLLEVDSDKQRAADLAERTRRKHFYRELGCKEIERLSYIMPPVFGTTPPPMEMMVFRHDIPLEIKKDTLKTWLQAIYTNVYTMSATDPRIDKMLEDVAEAPKLI